MHRPAAILSVFIAVAWSVPSPAAPPAGTAPTLSETLYNRAPDVLPGTLPEMRTPAYWVARMPAPDEVILTPAEIKERNLRFEARMRRPDPFADTAPAKRAILFPLTDRKKPLERPGRMLAVPDPHAMTPAARGRDAAAVLDRQLAYLHSMDFGNMYGVVYADWEIEAFASEFARDLLPAEPAVVDGITVRHARLRIVPSDFPREPGYKEGLMPRAWDMWNLTVLRPGRPVWVLHASRSGAFLFALTEEGYGWLDAETVAFTGADAIQAYAEPSSFVVCTGDRVPYYTDEGCRYISGWLRMGDRAPLPDPGEPRRIAAPNRLRDGSLSVEHGWLAPDADVHTDWLPYTRRNIVETAFKLLDNPYDWTGAYLERSHETTWLDLFACFGFRLPYQGELFTHFGGDDTVIQPGTSREETHRIMLAHEPFVTIQVSWEHAQLLLGDLDGVPIVFDNHGYDYKTEEGVLLNIKRTCVGDTRQPWYLFDHPITFLELK